jgi:hypothetical protein
VLLELNIFTTVFTTKAQTTPNQAGINLLDGVKTLEYPNSWHF